MDTEEIYEAYAERAYRLLRRDAIGLDAVYEDYIIESIGRYGLYALRHYKYLEACGMVNGRQLYTLCCEGES